MVGFFLRGVVCERADDRAQREQTAGKMKKRKE
jgi:hypothetical protein